MEDILFNVENTKILVSGKNGADVIEILERQFERPDLISRVRYRDNVGAPWGAWNEVASLIDDFISTTGMRYSLAEHNGTFNLNLGYFAPATFFADREAAFRLISNMRYDHLCCILSRRRNAEEIVSSLLGENKPSQSLSPLLTIQIAFAALGHKLVDRNGERKLISVLINYLDKSRGLSSELVQLALSTRLRKTEQREFKEARSSGMRIALLVCGQLRGYVRAIPTISKSVGKNAVTDVFVSTWRDSGITRINWTTLGRAVSKEAKEWLTENHSGLDLELLDQEINVLRKTQENDHLTNLKRLFSWANSISLSIKNEREYPYCKMSNPEKMYYHNSYWIETLGREKFSEYDLIIKIRPDAVFKDSGATFDSLAATTGDVYCESEGWVYREWGFGMGDQLIWGEASGVLDVLSCHGAENLTSRLVRDVFQIHPSYKGHINCGIANWLNGNDCLVSPVRHTALADTDRVSLELVQEAVERVTC